ncbi:MAG: hypothetical protein KAH11_01010 [Rhodospirillales bacterium]|jgi:hypothetical protein|nr:hypothetical protein [Rhodospirillales bacterium]
MATISDAYAAELASTSTEVGKWGAPRDSILYFPAHADAAVAQIVLANATGEATYALPLT